MQQALASVAILMMGWVLVGLPPHPSEAQADLSAKIAAAKSAADQEAIAAELDREAKELETNAAIHAEMAKHYDMGFHGHGRKASLKRHCEQLSASLKRSADLAREMAKIHRELAQGAEK